MDLKALEKELAKKSYTEIDSELRKLDDSELLHLLDSRSIRVGDSATEVLIARQQTGIVADALLASNEKKGTSLLCRKPDPEDHDVVG
jgi:hypothetical protein